MDYQQARLDEQEIERLMRVVALKPYRNHYYRMQADLDIRLRDDRQAMEYIETMKRDLELRYSDVIKRLLIFATQELIKREQGEAEDENKVLSALDEIQSQQAEMKRTLERLQEMGVDFNGARRAVRDNRDIDDLDPVALNWLQTGQGDDDF